jgi:hypothetical protein
MTNTFVAPTGYIDLDNDCDYSLSVKSTRSREEIDPKTDLAFYFDTYLVPKYGLNNINVNNVASFMKDLEMNWTKLTPELKGKTMDLMVDSVLSKDSSFKTDLLKKLGVSEQVPATGSATGPAPSTPAGTNTVPSVSTFGKSGFGSGSSGGVGLLEIAIGIIILGLVFFLIDKMGKSNTGGYARFK